MSILNKTRQQCSTLFPDKHFPVEKGQQAETEKYHTSARKKFFVRVMKHQNKLLREVPVSPLEIWKACLNAYLCDLL